MSIYDIINDIRDFIISFVAELKKFIAGFKTEVDFNMPAEPTTVIE